MVYEVDVAQVSYPQFLRSVGFVATPGILIILTPIPFVGQVAILMAFIWMAMATAVAIQHTLEAPYRIGRHGRVRWNGSGACDFRARSRLPAAVASCRPPARS